MSNGHRSLYLDIYHLGKRSYQFLSLYLTGDKIHDAEMMRVAETIRSRKEIEVQAGEHGVTPAHLKEGDFKAYLDKLAEEKGHPNYQVLAKHFRTFTGSRKVTFATLSPGLMEEFREWLLGQFSRNTAGLYFGYFKSSVRWAKEKGLLIRDPGEAVRAIKPVDIDRTFLSLDELRKLDATPCVRPEIRRAFLFACYTGLRISDIRALTWGKINNGRIEYRQRKTGKVEYLPLSEAATRYLGEPGEPDAPVFTLPASSNLYHGLNKWALSAGLGKVISFHVSRHTFATLTLTHGADLYTVSKLLGHSNIQTTQIYAKIVDEKKREAVNLIPAL